MKAAVQTSDRCDNARWRRQARPVRPSLVEAGPPKGASPLGVGSNVEPLHPVERSDQAEAERIFRGPGVRGDEFLLDSDATVDAIWGAGNQILWSKGEPLFVVGGPGTGKTTLVQQLALRRAGVRGGDLLDFPVEPGPGRCLYLAADRPKQAARSWRRMVTANDRAALSTCLVVHVGIFAYPISSRPEHLLPWVKSFPDVDTLFIDSLLNVAPKLADEEGAANTNEALQSVIRAGVEVVVIHHDRKRGSESHNVRLDDVYGGRALSAGAGSVIYLDGEPGTLKAKLRHLKVPATRIQSLDIQINARSGGAYVL